MLSFPMIPAPNAPHSPVPLCTRHTLHASLLFSYAYKRLPLAACKVSPLFSCFYKRPFPQLLSFDTLTNAPGVVGVFKPKSQRIILSPAIRLGSSRKTGLFQRSEDGSTATGRRSFAIKDKVSSRMLENALTACGSNSRPASLRIVLRPTSNAEARR